MDIFAINSSNKVITAAWDNYTDARNTYRGWWQIRNLSVKKDTPIVATSRAENHFLLGIKYSGSNPM